MEHFWFLLLLYMGICVIIGYGFASLYISGIKTTRGWALFVLLFALSLVIAEAGVGQQEPLIILICGMILGYAVRVWKQRNKPPPGK